MPDDSSLEQSRRLVYLAAERTLAGWIRTALSLMALGFVIDRFDLILRNVTGVSTRSLSYSRLLSAWGGSVLVGMGVLMAVAAGIHYLHFARRFAHDRDTRVGHSLVVGAGFALLLGVFGLALLGVLVIVLT